MALASDSSGSRMDRSIMANVAMFFPRLRKCWASSLPLGADRISFAPKVFRSQGAIA